MLHPKASIWIKLYLSLVVFDVIGAIFFLTIFYLSKDNLLPRLPDLLFTPMIILLKIWGLCFMYSLPLGIMLYGLWGIVYKEMVLGRSTLRPTQGSPAVFFGFLVLLFGIGLSWLVTQAVLAFR